MTSFSNMYARVDQTVDRSIPYLPADIWGLVAEHVTDVEDLGVLACVSKSTNRVCKQHLSHSRIEHQKYLLTRIEQGFITGKTGLGRIRPTLLRSPLKSVLLYGALLLIAFYTL